MEYLKRTFTRAVGICVARELHHNLAIDAHLHAFVHLPQKCNLRSADCLDWTYLGVKYHGNYQSAQAPARACAYVQKDGDFLTYGTLPERPRPHRKKNENTISMLIYEAIRDGKNLEYLNKHFGDYLVNHKKAVFDYYHWVKTLTTPLLQWVPLPIAMEPGPWDRIATWCNENLGKPRAHGQQQLYISGPTGMGKTYFTLCLSKYFKTYTAPNLEEFWDGLDESYELIVFDEFTTQHTVTFMNQLLDGSPMNLKQKGSQYHKTNNPSIIVLSNYFLRDNYCKVDDVVAAAIDRRLLQVRVETRCPFTL